MIWKPSVTVAAIVERDGRFLLVQEQTEAGLVFNQPAGHLEANESLVAAVARETLEETGWTVRPDSLVGVARTIASGHLITRNFTTKSPRR